ncbi:hypothetical protein B0H13DRAFT_2318797 [Mycena leptocephala]|nr:hypothetical protein B0H13DRAFT_2318797 [Mycena leptocephala]
MTNRFHLRNWTGQRALMWGQGILRQVNLRIHKAKLRYRYTRNTLGALNERVLMEEERAQREMVHNFADVEEGGIVTFRVVALGESWQMLSWIWYTAKASREPTGTELVEVVQGICTMRRWRKDTVLVEEEIRRTIVYGYWAAAKWESRGPVQASVIDEVLAEGLQAYVAEQAAREKKTSAVFVGQGSRTGNPNVWPIGRNVIGTQELYAGVSWGISYGGGQFEPGNLQHNKKNTQATDKLLAHEYFDQLLKWTNLLFWTFAPMLAMGGGLR